MRCLSVAVALVLILSGAACSVGDEKDTEPKAGRTASEPVPAARLATVTLPGRPGALVDLITERVRKAGTVRAEYASTATEGGTRLEEQITAQLRTGVRSPRAQLTIVDKNPDDPSTTEAVVLDGVVYTRVDGEEQAPGKPWVRLSRKDAGNPELKPFAKLLTGLIDQVEKALAQMSTDTGLALVRNGSFKGTPVKETLGGIQVSRYSGRTPVSKLSKTDTAFRALAELGLDEITWTLWVDDKGLPRKFRTEYTTPQEMHGSQSMTYSHWGEPVLIQAPPANKVHTIGG